MYDEPFADSSQIPTYLVSAMTRRHVTVALSGDGGDELFAGYNRYQLARRAWRGLSLLPRADAAALRGRDYQRFARALVAHARFHSGAAAAGAGRRQAAQARRRARACPTATRSLSAAGHALGAGRDRCPDAAEPQGRPVGRLGVAQDIPGLLERMQFLDLVTYLPDDILAKVDRASMAVALEARVPLLDHRVVEFAWRLPRTCQAARRAPASGCCARCSTATCRRHLVERPKMGFGIPLGGMAARAAARLGGSAARRTAAARGRPARRGAGAPALGRALSGRRNWQYLLWDVLMLEAWRQRWA